MLGKTRKAMKHSQASLLASVRNRHMAVAHHVMQLLSRLTFRQRQLIASCKDCQHPQLEQRVRMRVLTYPQNLYLTCLDCAFGINTILTDHRDVVMILTNERLSHGASPC